MKASIASNYGNPDVFQIGEISRPVPKEDEILVRVKAATVTGSDLMMRTGKPYIGRLYLGLMRPNKPVLGFDFAGEVVAKGGEVSSFEIGDRVFGGSTHLGAYAEFLCVNVKDVVAEIPADVSYEEAAPVTGSAVTVMNFLRGLVEMKAVDRVLINGASGSLGTYAVQIAKHFGAHVTGVCSGKNVDLVKSLGADEVIDYTREDFTDNGRTYDIIFDAVGKSSFSQCRDSLRPEGVYLSSVLKFGELLRMFTANYWSEKKVKFSSTGMLPAEKRLEYLLELKDMMKAGVLRSVIDRKYPLEEMGPAHAYVETGRKRGNLVIEPGRKSA